MVTTGFSTLKELMTTSRSSLALRRAAALVLLVGTLVVAGCGNATKTVFSTGANGQVTI